MEEFMKIWMKMNPIIEEAVQKAREVAEEVITIIKEKYWSQIEQAVYELQPKGVYEIELDAQPLDDNPILIVPTLVIHGFIERVDEFVEKLYQKLGAWASDARLRIVVIRPRFQEDDYI